MVVVVAGSGIPAVRLRANQNWFCMVIRVPSTPNNVISSVFVESSRGLGRKSSAATTAANRMQYA